MNEKLENKTIEKSNNGVYNASREEKIKESKMSIADTIKGDFYFKKIFGSIGNESILKDLLEAILDIEIKSIELRKRNKITSRKEKRKSRRARYNGNA